MFSVCPEGSILWGGHCLKYQDEDVAYDILNESILNIDIDNYAGLVFGQAMIHPKDKQFLAKPTHPSLGHQLCWTDALTLTKCDSGPLFSSRNGMFLMLSFQSQCFFTTFITLQYIVLLDPSQSMEPVII